MSIPEDNKVDRNMSEWHRQWQYDKIESTYGIHVLQKKTYEVLIEVDNEKHRIDSVVNKIAIEFQHTLSVSIDEMNSRYDAHSKYGLMPYLFIDLTMYDNYYDVNGYKLEKWLSSKYGINNKLFIEFSDHIMRFSNIHEEMFLSLSKDYFLQSLQLLEVEFEHSCLIEMQRLKQEEKQRKIRAEDERQQIAHFELEEYKTRRNESKEFEYFRNCFRNPLLKPTLMPFLEIIFSYEYENALVDRETYIKLHSYYSPDFQHSIKYMLVFEIKMDYKQRNRKQYFGEVKQFSHAAVELSGFSDRDMYFKINFGRTQKVDWVNFNIIPYDGF